MKTREVPIQVIDLPKIEGKSLILDIGAGGEGLVSRIHDKRVIAVDYNLLKIREAQIYQNTSQWICGDAGNLSIMDQSFVNSTIWFAMAYFREDTIKIEILKEVYRVLRNGGNLSLFVMRIDGEYDSVLFNALHQLPNGDEIQTGYHVLGRQNQTPEHVLSLLDNVGFDCAIENEVDHWFHIEATK